jgi:hypothetical protein
MSNPRLMCSQLLAQRHLTHLESIESRVHNEPTVRICTCRDAHWRFSRLTCVFGCVNGLLRMVELQVIIRVGLRVSTQHPPRRRQIKFRCMGLSSIQWVGIFGRGLGVPSLRSTIEAENRSTAKQAERAVPTHREGTSMQQRSRSPSTATQCYE